MKRNENNIELIKKRIPLEVRMEFISKLQNYMEDEFNIEMGEFEAEEILSIFCEKLGCFFFNTGVDEARNFFEARFVEAGEDLPTIYVGK